MLKYDLIGIHGKPRSGKDTISNYLCGNYNFVRHGPSVHVKDTAAVMFNVPREYFDDDNMKDQVDPFWGISYREMAQKVGKECSRDIFGEDFWMRHVERKLNEIRSENSEYNGMILADIRYANEVEWVKQHQGVVVFVVRDNRPTVSNEQHDAEKGLPLELADMVLYNNNTKQQLYQNAEFMLNYTEGWHNWDESETWQQMLKER